MSHPRHECHSNVIATRLATSRIIDESPIRYVGICIAVPQSMVDAMADTVVREAGTVVAVRGGLDRSAARNSRREVDAYGVAVIAIVAATRNGATIATLALLHSDADTLRPNGSGLANA